MLSQFLLSFKEEESRFYLVLELWKAHGSRSTKTIEAEPYISSPKADADLFDR